MIQTIAPERQTDEHGSGAFGAARIGHTHKGIDYACSPGSILLSPVAGVVTRLGWPYSPDDQFKGHFRLVEIKTPLGYLVRCLYVLPCVKAGSEISKGQKLGAIQDLTTVYEGITPHVHIDVKINGMYIDPRVYFKEID